MAALPMFITTDVPPNQTLFCHNLNTKIHINDLKTCLFEFFTPYGIILDVVASKTDPKKRGNAFVVFNTITGATTALRTLQGREFLGRPIAIAYAKTKSDKVAILDGTYKMKRHRVVAARQAKLQQTFSETENVASRADDTTMGARATDMAPGTTLFVENLPDIMNEAALTILFKQYPGFKEARLIQGRSVAFVDFANEFQAEVAMRGLNNFLVTPEAALSISVAKRA